MTSMSLLETSLLPLQKTPYQNLLTHLIMFDHHSVYFRIFSRMRVKAQSNAPGEIKRGIARGGRRCYLEAQKDCWCAEKRESVLGSIAPRDSLQ